jgi:cytochrome c-type biogenesis protein CcmH
MINRNLERPVILSVSQQDTRRISTSNPPHILRARGSRRLKLTASLLVIASFAVLPLLAQQQSDRVKQIGGKFLCMCGCSQILTQCNHVGCTMSSSMLKELGAMVGKGDSEDKITEALVQEYGTTVYAEPPAHGFSLVAWLMPVFYFVVGAALVVFFINKWRKQAPAAPAVAPAGVNISPEALERARSQANRDTED